MSNVQVKSKQRVADHGEVFTAEREIKAMCDLVADECLRIDSRFLEPACGEGYFLEEILSRKLDVVTRRYKKNSYDYERFAILALGSIYGVDIQMDNVLLCRDRLFDQWKAAYEQAVKKKKERNEEVLESARYILDRNIICGDELTLHTVDENGKDTGKPIIFSQWAFATGPMIKREDYTFEELLSREDEPKKPANQQMELDLKGDQEEDGEGSLVQEFPPIHYRRLKEYG